MAIDPTAATGATAANLPSSTDAAVQGNATGADAAKFENASLEAGQNVSLPSYMDNQVNEGKLPLEALSPEGKANYLANPTALGDKVIGYLEKFHQRMESTWGSSTALSGASNQTSSSTSGPAALVPEQAPTTSAGGEASGQGNAAETDPNAPFMEMLRVAEQSALRSAESRMVSGVGQQFSRSMNTLLRGQ